MPKIKRPSQKDYHEAYQGLSLTPVESTGRPSTPHSFFSRSFSTETPQRIHLHVNGLAVVAPNQWTDDIKVLVKEGELVRPKDVLAKTGTTEYKAYVMGNVVEINPNLHIKPKDPLLDGYICIIQPQGKFPPPE